MPYEQLFEWMLPTSVPPWICIHYARGVAGFCQDPETPGSGRLLLPKGGVQNRARGGVVTVTAPNKAKAKPQLTWRGRLVKLYGTVYANVVTLLHLYGTWLSLTPDGPQLRGVQWGERQQAHEYDAAHWLKSTVTICVPAAALGYEHVTLMQPPLVAV